MNDILAKILETCDALIKKCTKENSASEGVTIPASSMTSNLNFWLSNMDNSNERKVVLKKCSTMRSKCTSLIRGGTIPKEAKKADPKKPKVEDLGPKPIQQPSIRVSNVATAKSPSTARLKKRPSTVSVQKILSGEPITPAAPSVTPRAPQTEPMELSRGPTYSAAMTASSSVPMYASYPANGPDFLPFRYVAHDYIDGTAVGEKRKREGKGKSVRWADCIDSGQLVETKLFIPQEEEFIQEFESNSIDPDESMDMEDEGEQNVVHIVETERDLNKERLYILSHKKPKEFVPTVSWSSPRILEIDSSDLLQPPINDSKEFKIQTLRLSKLEALLASNTSGVNARKTPLTSSLTDPEDPPKESFEGLRKSASTKEYHFFFTI